MQSNSQENFNVNDNTTVYTDDVNIDDSENEIITLDNLFNEEVEDN